MRRTIHKQPILGYVNEKDQPLLLKAHGYYGRRPAVESVSFESCGLIFLDNPSHLREIAAWLNDRAAEIEAGR